MYYDEGSRRQNYLTGFALGLVLGAGLSWLLPGEARRKAGRRVRSSWRDKQAGRARHALRSGSLRRG